MLFDRYTRGPCSFGDAIPHRALDGRQLDRALAIQHQQQSAAHHVAKCTVSLPPLPGFAQLPRQLPAAQFRATLNQPANEVDLVVRYAPSAIDHDLSLPENGSERK